MADETPKNWFDRQPPIIRHAINTLVTLGVMFAGVLVVWASGKLGVPAPVIPAVQAEQPDDLPPTGWYSDPVTVQAARAAVPVIFRDTPAGAVEADPPPFFYQWQVHQKVTGKPTEEKDQNPVGSCVGFGSTTAYERALVCAIAAGQPFDFTKFSEESIYAISRVVVGGGRLRGDDGSVGGWAAKGLTDYGLLPEGTYDGQDWAAYNPTRCRQVGDRGLPANLMSECLKYRAGAAANLKTWSDVKRAISSGHGVFTCSIQGFTAQRDSNGVCRPSGRWGHAMCLDGYHTDAATGKEYGHFDNSWDGVYHKGPVGWGNPSGTGFWCEASVISRMLNEGDSWAVSAVKGFPKQQIVIDWFAHARPAPRKKLAFDTPFALAP